MKKVFSEFLNETGEWHALWFGFYSAFFKLKREKLSEELKSDIEREYHYYLIGFFLARVAQAILIAVGISFGV